MTQAEEIGAGTLKCAVASPPSRATLDAMASALAGHVRDADVRSPGDAALLIFTDAEPSQVRDWIAPALQAGASLIVVEFERWSSRGDAIDTRWLLRRGH